MFFISISPNRFNGNLGRAKFWSVAQMFWTSTPPPPPLLPVTSAFLLVSTAMAAQHEINFQTSALSWLVFAFLAFFFFRSIIIIVIQPSIESLLACIDASVQSFCYVGLASVLLLLLHWSTKKAFEVCLVMRAPNNANEKQNRAEKRRRTWEKWC